MSLFYSKKYTMYHQIKILTIQHHPKSIAPYGSQCIPSSLHLSISPFFLSFFFFFYIRSSFPSFFLAQDQTVGNFQGGSFRKNINIQDIHWLSIKEPSSGCLRNMTKQDKKEKEIENKNSSKEKKDKKTRK